MERRLELRVFPERLQLRDGGDGRTVFGRVVPFNTITEFEDHDGQLRRERFIRGALAQARKAWNRVVLYYSHADILPNRLGHGLELEERQDGGYATFRLDEYSVAQAREVLSTSHQGLSLGFYPDLTRAAPDDVLDRLKVSVEHVAAVPDGAYPEARVLALREAAEGEEPPATPRLAAALADLAYLKADPTNRAIMDGLR